MKSPTQDNLIIHEEQTQDPKEPMLHEPVPLRRSTRERRNVIPDDYVVFLQEHEEEHRLNVSPENKQIYQAD